MLKIFQRWTRVKEVFISKRLNRWERRLGFVRFFKVENEARLEKQLDQIYIGNKRLYVNIPRYRRGRDFQVGGLSEVSRTNKKQFLHKPVKQRTEEVLREKKGKEAQRDRYRKQPYVDAVRKTTIRPLEGSNS